jgi:hypothetical protein
MPAELTRQPAQSETSESLPTHLRLPETWLIGSGQVVDKYWFRALGRGLVNITGIVSLEDESAFRERHPDFKGRYHQTKTLEETVEFLAGVIPLDKESIIANVATANVRLPLTKLFLQDERFDHTKLFLDKPYGVSIDEIRTLRDLIEQYPDRIHLSGKYAAGRGNILYKHLPLNIIPKSIDAKLIEGTPYFRIVNDRVQKEGSHPYLVDGPEWDIGFHIMSIIAEAADRFGGFSHFKLVHTADTSTHRPGFDPGYGFTAGIFLVTREGVKIPVETQVGKSKTASERFVKFNYSHRNFNYTICQYYPTGKAIDPVFVVSDNKIKEFEEHTREHDYYAAELQPELFGHQSHEKQMRLISIAEFCFKLKEARQSQQN